MTRILERQRLLSTIIDEGSYYEIPLSIFKYAIKSIPSIDFAIDMYIISYKTSNKLSNLIIKIMYDTFENSDKLTLTLVEIYSKFDNNNDDNIDNDNNNDNNSNSIDNLNQCFDLLKTVKNENQRLLCSKVILTNICNNDYSNLNIDKINQILVTLNHFESIFTQFHDIKKYQNSKDYLNNEINLLYCVSNLLYILLIILFIYY
jgi:hypothetical protein